MELHHQLKNRVEIIGNLVLDTALHVGTSQQVGRSDSPVIRTQFGEVFIPGSSLKGAFRSKVESLAHILDENAWVCFLQKAGGSSHRQCLTTYSKGATEIQERADGAKPEELAEFLEENLCIACRLFGGASWRSKVLFDDLHLLQSYNFPTELRDGVGIDRDTRKAVEGVKYDFEAIPAGSRFQFRLVAENLGKQDWALLSIGLLEMLQGYLSLGGKTSRGLGSCHLETEKLKITNVDFTDKQSALNYFSTKPSAVDEPPEEWFLKKLNTYLNQQ